MIGKRSKLAMNQITALAGIRAVNVTLHITKAQYTQCPCQSTILGYIITLFKASLDRATLKLYRLFKQGASNAPLVQYVKNCIRWVTTGVSFNIKALILKTTEIVQTRFSVKGLCWL